MEPIQFCYWLQGFAEINGSPPTEEQWKAIKEHLQTVFVKVTPPYVPPTYVPPPPAIFKDDPNNIYYKKTYYSSNTTGAIC